MTKVADTRVWKILTVVYIQTRTAEEKKTILNTFNKLNILLIVVCLFMVGLSSYAIMLITAICTYNIR